MSFCPKCGRQRGASGRFCGGCGNDFGSPAAGPGTASTAEPVTEVPFAAAPWAAEAAGEPAAEATGSAPAAAEPGAPAMPWQAGETRWDVPPEQTRLDRPADAGHADPFAVGFADTSPAVGTTPAPGAPDQWEAADTVYAEPPRAAPGTPPYALPSPPAPAHPLPPAPEFPAQPSPAAPARRPGGYTRLFVIIGVVVALAAGGGAYAFTRSHWHPAAQPQASPSTSSQADTTAPSLQASASPTAGTSTPPAASPSASVTPSPARTGTVQAAPGAASDPAAPQVEAYLNRYFSSINTRNYSEYNSLLDAQEQQGDSRSTFDSGFATTKDSNEVLTGIEHTGGGSLTANVSFTSHQSPADSVDGSACNNWQISLYLVPQGSGYVMTAAPAGYHAGYTDC